MERARKRFHGKHGITSRIFSLVLVFVMLFTMVSGLPGGQLTAQAATPTIRLYLEKPDDWTTPVINMFDSGATVNNNGAGNATIAAWSQEKPKLALDSNTGLYYVDVQSAKWDGFQFVNAETAAEIKVSSYDGNPLQVAILNKIKSLSSDTSAYCLKDSNGDMAWFSGSNNTSDPFAEAAELDYVSPEVNGRQVTFRVKHDAYNSAAKVTVPGGMNDWDVANGFPLTKGDDDMWSGTFEVAPGVYEYKFAPGAWSGDIADPANPLKSGTNSKLIVPGLKDGNASIKKGEEVALPETFELVKEDGSTEDVAVTYSLKTPNANVTISDNKITVETGYASDKLDLTVSAGDKTSTMALTLVDKLYTYTIYYYDFDASHMSTTAADLWIWDKNGAGATEGTVFTGTEVLSDGNTWLKTEITVPYTDVMIIARSFGTWEGGWQTGNLSYTNKDKAENKTIYITSTEVVSETLPELIPPRDRYVLVEYDRPAGDYTGWNIFTWNSGFGSDVSVPVQELGGKMVAKIPVKDSRADLMLSFCMRKSETGNDWAEKDGGDHYVNVPANQTVVKARFVQDEGIVEVLPYNTGYTMDGANGMIHFYYRDDTLSANNNLASLDGKVSVTVNGTEHAMTYDAATDRFCFDLTGVETGDYYYYYTVDSQEQLDAFNAETGNYNGKDCSKCTYRKFNMTISADMSQAAMDYNDNNVLTVNYHPADGQSMDGFAVTSATVDLSALGLSSTQAINTELMALSIACKDTTTAGVKTLPVTVTDVYGNVYTANASVTVEARNKSGDFDWDEAVIYFAVTDRFFDGNAANNNAYGVNDYNTGDKGGSSYHGGDFAGLTAKLDYLKELGVNTIWITPIVENITEDQHDGTNDFATYGYHGYWASDFTQLNQHLGTREEFQALLDAAHSRNMKIMVDVVLNHAGYGTEDHFNSILTDENGNAISMVRGDDNTVSGDDKLDALSGLPDFATENPAVRNQLVQWQTQWMDEFDIDYYRVDTVKHVDNTTWAAFKNSLTKVNPDFKMIGEYAGAGYANTAGELGTGTMDSLLDFDFNGWAEDFVTGNISGIEQNLQRRNGAINNTATMGSFLSSHDEDTLQALLVEEKNVSAEEAYNLAKVAATLQITAKGQPVIYYGEEIGQAGANDWPFQTNRRDFDWAELAKQQNDETSMYHHYKTMLGIRNDYSALFAKGSRTTVAQSDAEGYEVISRSYGGDTLYVGMNIKGAAKSVTIPVDAEPNTVMVNLYDKTPYTVSADKTVTISIPAVADGGTFVLAEDKNNEYRLVIPVTDDFTEVVDTITAVPDGTGIVVVLEGTTVVPVEVFNTAAGRDVDLFFSVGDAAMWSLNGKSIVTRPTAGIDFGVTLGGNKIAADKIKEVAGDNKTLQVSLAHDGKFGFDAGLLLLVGTQYEGQYANLFYYNPTTGKLEYAQTDKVEEGYVFYTFSHASDYVIVFSGSDMNPDLNKTANTTPTVSKPKTGDSTPFGATLAVLMIAAAVMAGVVVRRRMVRR